MLMLTPHNKGTVTSFGKWKYNRLFNRKQNKPVS